MHRRYAERAQPAGLCPFRQYRALSRPGFAPGARVPALASFAGRPPLPCLCHGPRKCGSQSGQRPKAEARARAVRQ